MALSVESSAGLCQFDFFPRARAASPADACSDSKDSVRDAVQVGPTFFEQMHRTVGQIDDAAKVGAHPSAS